MAQAIDRQGGVKLSKIHNERNQQNRLYKTKVLKSNYKIGYQD